LGDAHASQPSMMASLSARLPTLRSSNRIAA
jgi:hypothetical protein